MSISTRVLPGTTIDPLYPDSDGEPLGETQFHIMAIVHLFEALKHFFSGRGDVCVLADSFMYYEEAGGIKSKAPDVMVAFGVSGNHPRRSFRIKEEGVAPAVIIEITSKKTHEEDERGKKQTYAWLGVKEYFLFDPEDLILDPRLQGFRLHEGHYVPLPADAQGRLMSRELGMLLEAEDTLMRLIDTRTGRRLMSFDELFEVADEAERKILQAQREADQARERAEQARERAAQARERAEQAAERAEQARDQADEARRQTDQARQQAEQARERAERAERQAEIERHRNLVLEAELAQLRAARNQEVEE